MMIEWGLIVKAVRYSGFKREVAYNIISPESAEREWSFKSRKEREMDVLQDRFA